MPNFLLLDENGFVVNRIVVNDPAEFPDWHLRPDEAGVDIGFRWDGKRYLRPARAPAVVEAEIVADAQAMLDAFAQQRGFDGILSACSYATSGVERFKADALVCIGKRDEMWAGLYRALDLVKAGTIESPDRIGDIQHLLPTLEWTS